MATQSITMEGGDAVEVEISPATKGRGVKVDTRLKPLPDDPNISTTVTCTCYDGGYSYSTTKECPNGNNTCDCSSPRNPRITCG